MVPYPERGDMPDILAENLSGKAVMGTDGAELGILYNITMNLKTGKLGHLVVQPHEETGTPDPSADGPFDVDDEGHYHVPVSNVQAVRDYIVIDR